LATSEVSSPLTFAVDNFSEIVLKHADEIRAMMIETFPQMPKMEGIK
jgi:hypothetical protein